jgi:hypothetical protein
MDRSLNSFEVILAGGADGGAGFLQVQTNFSNQRKRNT